MPWIWSDAQDKWVWARNPAQAAREENNRNNLHNELRRLRQNEVSSAERQGELRSELQQVWRLAQAGWNERNTLAICCALLQARLKETQMEFLSERAVAQDEKEREKQMKDAEEKARRELAEAEQRLKHAEETAKRDLAQEALKKQEARNHISELRETLADEKVKRAFAVEAHTEAKEAKRACQDSLLIELAAAQESAKGASEKLGIMEESMACACEEMSEMESQLEWSTMAEDRVVRLELELATASD
ncbi:unnamed protein product [Symbiodinium sp. CCMP2592]|nr:unnamed protein product [Symbiodinium sp. CCMP2592]